MKSIVRGGVAIAVMALVAGCAASGSEGGAADGKAAPSAPTLAADTPVVIGAPFMVQGVTYTPVDISDYDEVGFAGVYSADLAGKPTANGEIFDPAAISAAHKTLPLPSYVEVTALDTGRTILVRVNDRGPMVNDRLIDLSPAAAAQLGLTDTTTGVRVRRVHPPAAERAQLRAGRPVPERLPTPDSLLAILRSKLSGMPSPAAIAAGVAKPATPAAPPARVKPGDDRLSVEGPNGQPAPPTASAPPKPVTAVPKPTPATTGSYSVQVATFGNKANADATAKELDGAITQAGNLWRVTMGPFASEAEAQSALAKAKAKGFGDALIRRER
ncbi:septal ring lytic transglycosylase RlpA family protein [Sphingopyxis indica]|uniref:Endolytic peptidoglycan transglycosylase RlpA n=1 Tax=Sphingopyxis indica TaxID=436663 RepID=A0A239EG78_9SPHN|nr:septal ring lytic transglycosylase RlpA family protein [Sphingopyxis indica]SNS43665.1 rare lipoprotein A [Sphingopyxis indica]